MNLVTWSLVAVEKVENMGGGEPGMMWCKFREIWKVEHIFQFLFVKNSTNLSAKS